MKKLGGTALILAFCFSLASAQTGPAPAWEGCLSACDINQLRIQIDNFGIFSGSSGQALSCKERRLMIFEGEEYPKNSKQQYVGGIEMWVGGIVNGDTLSIAEGYASGIRLGEGYDELYPEPAPFGYLQYRSTLDPAAPEYDGAVSEQDYYGKVTDIGLPYSLDPVTRRRNKRMFAEISFATHAWSYQYAEDFVLVDITVTNIGTSDWNQAYVGVHMGGNHGEYTCDTCFDDEYHGMCGLLRTYQSFDRCDVLDTFNIMWSSSNDGEPINGVYQEKPHYDPIKNEFIVSTPNVMGVCPLRYFNSDYLLSYNWWATRNITFTDDFGPRRNENFRDYQNGYFANPRGTKNVYSVLSNGEIDFDQAYSGLLNHGNIEWVYKSSELQNDIANGAMHAQVLSVGPFNLSPGASISFPFAIVGGEHFHHDPNNKNNNLPGNPAAYTANLDFSDLAKNATWAEWIYDNPGVDTDGDGYFGESRVCVTDSALIDGEWTPTRADTVWYRGDGVPDWRAAGPPPPPYVKVTPLLNGLKIHFNGERSETEKDIFTQIVDFEGYRIYWGRDARRSSLATVASYDHEDYDKWVFIPRLGDSGFVSGDYEIKDIPYTIDSLRCAYGRSCTDSAFDPLQYTSFAPLHIGDSTLYFTKHDYNVSELGTATPIHKVYPAARDPRGIPVDSLMPDDYTEEGHLKFFEYELTIDNLLPSVSYCVNVTAFDFGSPLSGIAALETSPTLNIKQAYPAASQAELDGDDLKVYVYPNPYRIDENYRAEGYEGRVRQDFPNDKVRQLNFANLPFRCTIRVYTLDGDLVVEKQHDADPSDPTGRHDYWSLINRNRQIIVSGLYYWTVEDSHGKVQIGKFVVLR